MKHYVKFMLVDTCKRIDVYKMNKVYISNDESITYINKNSHNAKHSLYILCQNTTNVACNLIILFYE